jgi:hypothetical protein
LQPKPILTFGFDHFDEEGAHCRLGNDMEMTSHARNTVVKHDKNVFASEIVRRDDSNADWR